MEKSVEQILEEVKKENKSKNSKEKVTDEFIQSLWWCDEDESLIWCSFVMPFKKWINVIIEDGSRIPYDEWEWNSKNKKTEWK